MKMSEILKGSKGQMGGLGALPAVAVTFVVVGVVFAIGFTILNNQQATFTSGSYAYNATQKAQDGMSQITGYLPTIGLVVAAVIVIGLVVGLLYMRGK
jgi:MFS superfamily sulfate permease-like transporter